MIEYRTFLIGYKLLFSLLGLSAIITEIATTIERNTFNPVNFFSFFTVENNILAAISLILSALFLAAGKRAGWLDTLRGISTVFILVVGIGFAVLLSGLEGIILTAVPWDNIVLHYIMPIAILIDYLIDRPKTQLTFVNSLSWLLFPLSYVGYCLVRGAATGWYPYPFLNPNTNSYSSIALTVFGLLLLSLTLIYGAVKLSGGKHKDAVEVTRSSKIATR